MQFNNDNTATLSDGRIVPVTCGTTGNAGYDESQEQLAPAKQGTVISGICID